LYKIGKGCDEYKDKIESWEKLFSMHSRDLRKLGIPTKQRKWILNWTEKYRQGIEPYSIRFKSKSVKNRHIRLEKQQAHLEQLKKVMIARKKAKNQARNAKRALKKKPQAAERKKDSMNTSAKATQTTPSSSQQQQQDQKEQPQKNTKQ